MTAFQEPPMPAAATDSSEALRIAQEMYTFYVLGDTPGMRSLFAPDAHVVIPGDPAVVPWAGVYTGAQAELFHSRVKDSVDVFEYSVKSYEPHGDTVIAYCRERARAKATGKIFVNEHVGIVTVRDGKIVRYLEYGDTAAFQAAFTE
jgi:ketosteroid isomerase-like protein